MYQKITLVGNLGGDPEMRYMQDGTAVTNFGLATNRRWNDRNTGQPVDETTWFRVSAFGKKAESCNQYLAKGSRVLVTGRLRPDPQTGGPRVFTRNDGSAGASFELVADEVRFLTPKAEADATAAAAAEYGPPPQAQTQQAVQQNNHEEDDIPF